MLDEDILRWVPTIWDDRAAMSIGGADAPYVGAADYDRMLREAKIWKAKALEYRAALIKHGFLFEDKEAENG